jgi:hypothetical protein
MIEYIQPILRRRHIKLHYLLLLNAVNPEKRCNITAYVKFYQLLQEELVQRRVVKNTIVGIIMNE